MNHTQWKLLLTDDSHGSVCVTANCLKNVNSDPNVLKVGYVSLFITSLLSSGEELPDPLRMPPGTDATEFFDVLKRYSGLEYDLSHEVVDFVTPNVSFSCNFKKRVQL